MATENEEKNQQTLLDRAVNEASQIVFKAILPLPQESRERVLKGVCGVLGMSIGRHFW